MNFKYVGFVILAIALVLIYIFINPSEVDFLPKCPFYFTTGLYCPGCGSQRATHQLLNFNFKGVIAQNILFVVCIFILIYHITITVLNTYFKKNYFNYLNHAKTGWIVLIFILVFWISRNIPCYPFELLAPK
ncbi:DUF2752 domain-containing protein [Lutibacter sp. HS1-25]|uniref:DUF2752 domain-containing protein n=1 Tax=Lutibacter sp. HS1-25 TaxID=2485000 RepID=UPI001012064E|nr:DUF2752 domain-containing protein [Lutibacter sp. HS1-25]